MPCCVMLCAATDSPRPTCTDSVLTVAVVVDAVPSHLCRIAPQRGTHTATGQLHAAVNDCNNYAVKPCVCRLINKVGGGQAA